MNELLSERCVHAHTCRSGLLSESLINLIGAHWAHEFFLCINSINLICAHGAHEFFLCINVSLSLKATVRRDCSQGLYCLASLFFKKALLLTRPSLFGFFVFSRHFFRDKEALLSLLVSRK